MIMSFGKKFLHKYLIDAPVKKKYVKDHYEICLHGYTYKLSSRKSGNVEKSNETLNKISLACTFMKIRIKPTYYHWLKEDMW